MIFVTDLIRMLTAFLGMAPKLRGFISGRRNLEITQDIENRLGELCISIGADRVYIAQLHNGEKFYSGQHIERLTCSYDYPMPGVPSKKDPLKGVVASTYFSVFKDIQKHGYSFLDDDMNPKANGNRIFKDRLRTEGIKSYVCVPIERPYGRADVIGILGAEWLHQKAEIDNSIIEVMKSLADKISGQIMATKISKR